MKNLQHSASAVSAYERGADDNNGGGGGGGDDDDDDDDGDDNDDNDDMPFLTFDQTTTL